MSEDKTNDHKPNVPETSVSFAHVENIISVAETEEVIFRGKELVVSYRLPNGFTLLGRAACVDPANFDIDLGRSIAKKQAIDELWKLEGYVLQQRLYEESVS